CRGCIQETGCFLDKLGEGCMLEKKFNFQHIVSKISVTRAWKQSEVCRVRKRMKASERISDGANKSAAGAAEHMQMDDAMDLEYEEPTAYELWETALKKFERYKEKPSQNSSNDNMNTVSNKEKPSQNNSKVNMNTVSSKEKPSQNNSKVNMNTVSNKVKPTTNKATKVTSRQNEVSTAPQLGSSRDKQTTAATRRSSQPSREPQ
ncbi:hypothetical protein L9F63_021986, partial [Diploptera punctata]